MKMKQGESNVWRGIRRTWKHVVENIKWRVKDGKSTSFRMDVWAGDRPLICFSKCRVDPNEVINSVDKYMKNGEWDWPVLRNILSEQGCAKVASIVPPMPSSSPDVISWRSRNDGVFSVNSAYAFLNKNSNFPTDGIWKRVWTWNTCIERLCRFAGSLEAVGGSE